MAPGMPSQVLKLSTANGPLTCHVAGCPAGSRRQLPKAHPKLQFRRKQLHSAGLSGLAEPRPLLGAHFDEIRINSASISAHRSAAWPTEEQQPEHDLVGQSQVSSRDQSWGTCRRLSRLHVGTRSPEVSSYIPNLVRSAVYLAISCAST